MTINQTPTHLAQARTTAKSRQRVLGKALGRLYASVTLEPAPDDFLMLLAETDSRLTARTTT